MKRRFVVIIAGETDADTSAIVEYAKANRYGWWHFIRNNWLLISYNILHSAAQIRDDLRKLTGEKNLVVLEVTGSTTWAAFGPSVEGNNISQWIQETWNPD